MILFTDSKYDLSSPGAKISTFEKEKCLSLVLTFPRHQTRYNYAYLCGQKNVTNGNPQTSIKLVLFSNKL